MLVAGLLLLAVQAPGDATAAETRAALIDAKVRMEAAEACPGARDGARRARYRRLRAEALGLIPYLDPAIGDTLGPLACRRAALRLATAALDRLAAAVARRRSAMRGLWFGPLPLCGNAVLAVEGGKNEMNEPRVLLRFSPATAEVVRIETSNRVNVQLPLVLDGRTLVEPFVREPITGGEVSIAGGDLPGGLSVADLRAAAARPCTD
jgi:hypothetical protein